MDIVTKAFHEMILQANRAHKAYNEVGTTAALLALQDLHEQVMALAHRISNEKPREV